MSDPAVKSVIAVANRLKSDRSPEEAVWQEIRDLTYPSAQALTSKETPGTKQGLRVLDNTGEQAGELLTAALFAGATPTHEPWIAVGVEGYDKGADRDADLWLDEATKFANSEFNATEGGFATGQDEKLMDYVHLGTGCMYLGERPGKRTLFQARPLAECLIQEGEDGRVNANYRMYERSARQVCEWAKAENVSAGEKTLAKAGDPKKAEDKVKLIHAVYPRLDYDRQRADDRNMPFASCWINVDEQ